MFLFLDKYINQNKCNAASKILRVFKKTFFVAIISLALFSCQDEGCIEADDFGEYQTQTLEVVANSNTDACVYDPSKSIIDSSQGSELKKCFTSGDITITDETKATQSSSGGCNGLLSDKFKNLCITQCVNECAAKVGSGVSSSEPAWNSTKKYEGRSNGVNIRPDAQVSVRAVGLVALGDKFEYPQFFLRGDQFSAQSFKSDWSNQILDIPVGKSLSVSFSGQINDGSSANGATSTIGKVGAGTSTAIDEKAYNAARRIVAYLIKHPDEYDFDASKNNEREGAINVPLLPDANMWQCEYSSANFNQADCKNKSYRNNGYPQADDVSVEKNFPITSSTKSPVLGKFGGIIRWQDDGLQSDKSDPFGTINCNTSSCAGASAIDSALGKIVGDLSGGDVVIKPIFSSKVSFKNLLTSSACDGEIEIAVRSDGATKDILNTTILVNKNSWSNQHISVEANQELVIKKNDTKRYTDTSGASINCGRALAVKFGKYHDILIEQSGLVSFAILNATDPVGCKINARIINPEGSHFEIASGFNPDFYEYNDFSSETDILKDFNVPGISALTSWEDGTSNNGSAKVFLRKGQVIRFSPESWDGTWNSNGGGARNCGIGMAMKIEPRPALLCRGYSNDNVANPKCIFKYENGALAGCSEYAPECDDAKTTLGTYCPNVNCLKTIKCSAGSETSNPKYTASNCSVGEINSICKITSGGTYSQDNCDKCSSPEIPLSQQAQVPDRSNLPKCLDVSGACNIDAGSTYSRQNCDNCSAARLRNAQQSPFISQPNMAQCYDLENYKGKVSNIPIGGFSEVQLNNSTLAKGATKLTNFNGEYGNLESFQDEGKKDENYSKNVILQVKQNISTQNSGRLKFIFLDGDDFLNIQSPYNDNTLAGSSYNGSNGFKINVSSSLEYKNGEWLEVLLCAETSDKSADCKSLTEPTPVKGQPDIVRLYEPVAGEFKSRSKTSFLFDQYGSMMRFNGARVEGDCLGVMGGDGYYCHTERTVNPSLLKLTFKIKDPETPNCNMENPMAAATTATGNNYNGIITPNNNFHANDCDISNPDDPNPAVKNGIIVLDANNRKACVVNSDAGKICAAKDEDCKAQYRCVNKYTNNSGKYYVSVRVKEDGKNMSKIVGQVVSPVIEIMDGKKDKSTIGQAERIYRLIIEDARYKAILNMSLIVMLTFYGLTYLMGMHEAGITDILNRMIKISVIYLFVGPQGWYWFDKIVVNLFKNGTDYLSFLMASSFDESPELQRAIEKYDFYDKSVLFGSVDKVFGLIFSKTVLKKISALLFASIFGWAYLMIIYYGMLAYVYAVANAVLLYLTAQVFISVLFVLGPLFFVFTLFNQTKEMFDKWLTQLIGYSLQQVFLLTTLAFFNMMMYEVIKMALGYKICWDEVWTINIVTRITLMSFWTIAALPSKVDSQSEAGNIGNNDGIPSFFVILFIWVIAELMLSFITFMTDIASDLSGSLKLGDLGKGVKDSIKTLQNSDLGKLASKAWDNSVGEATRSLDKLIFSSGKKAHDERVKKRQEMSVEMSQKSAISSAGKKAMQNYKLQNMEKLAQMSKEGQEEVLKKVRDDGMVKKGKELGLSEDQVKALAKKKGLKYIDDNIVFGGIKAIYQSSKEGGAFYKSIESREIDTDFKAKEVKKAMKETDAKGRATIVDAVKRGKLYVKGGSFDNGSESGYSSKDYDEATKQLVETGEVTNMRKGTGWTRSSVEKAKIAKRAQQNANEKRIANKKSNIHTITDLEIERRVLDGGAKGKPFSRSNPVTKAIFGKRKYNGNSRNKLRGEILRGANGEATPEQIERQELYSELSKARTGESQSRARISKAQEKINEITQKPSYAANQKKMRAANEVLFNTKDATAEQKELARDALAEVKNDKQFQEQRAEIKAAWKIKKDSEVSLNNHTKKIEKINKTLNPEDPDDEDF